jgi:hypothetical protein
MKLSISIASAAALAACLAALCATSVTPERAHAAEVKIDPQILSAAPFHFQADRGILSTMPGAPADSRIFMQPKPLPLPSDLRMSDAHAATQTRV